MARSTQEERQANWRRLAQTVKDIAKMPAWNPLAPLWVFRLT
jgi:hypothetical protein